MDYLTNLSAKFDALIGELKEELSAIRTNRPTPRLIEDIPVQYGEQTLLIKQVGSIMAEAPRNLIVTPWDKESLNNIVKAIEEAKLGLTPSVSGAVVRVTLPQLTDERRQELMKTVKGISEEIRIKMRISRDEVNKLINQDPDDDGKFRNKEKLQKLVDSFNAKVDELTDAKIKEISL